MGEEVPLPCGELPKRKEKRCERCIAEARELPPAKEKAPAGDEASTGTPGECKTRKDKHVSKWSKTCGVLGIAHCCGIFAMLRELYITESVTQVIQALADLRSANPLLLRFAYDDA